MVDVHIHVTSQLWNWHPICKVSLIVWKLSPRTEFSSQNYSCWNELMNKIINVWSWDFIKDLLYLNVGIPSIIFFLVLFISIKFIFIYVYSTYIHLSLSIFIYEWLFSSKIIDLDFSHWDLFQRENIAISALRHLPLE